MFKIEAAQRMKAAQSQDHQWVDKVEQKQKMQPDEKPDFPEGFFNGSPSSIAQGLKSKSKDFKEAMSRLNFYINRGGKNIDMTNKQRLEQAKDALYRIYGEKPPEKKPGTV